MDTTDSDSVSSSEPDDAAEQPASSTAADASNVASANHSGERNNSEQPPQRSYPRRDGEYNSYSRQPKDRVNRPAVEMSHFEGVMTRSIFAKNLPDGTTQEDMEAAFSVAEGMR